MLLSPLLAGLLATPFASAAFTVGERFQIVLSAVPDLSANLVPDAPVFDIDMFDTNTTVIAGLKKLGKTVICYFSAGTYEPWRPDAAQFKKEDYGLALDGWPDEKWLKLDSANVRNIMTARIKMAADKGCDAIDPDNTGKLLHIHKSFSSHFLESRHATRKILVFSRECRANKGQNRWMGKQPYMHACKLLQQTRHFAHTLRMVPFLSPTNNP